MNDRNNDNFIADAFADGLKRVAAVIDINPDYHAIIGHKISEDFRARLRRAPDSESLVEIAHAVSTMKLSTYALPDVDLLFFGRTYNNRREFQFLLDVLKDSTKHFVHANVAELKFAGRVHEPQRFHELFERLKPELSSYLEMRDATGPELVYQLGQYVVHFLRYWMSLHRPDSSRPSLAVVANDHSPNAVAYSQAMQANKVPTLYLQHAEVSAGFPPLNFDYSVLRNPSSLRIYEKIGQPAGRTYAISRYPDAFAMPAPIAAGETVSVVIYTTGRIDLPGLERTLAEMRQNPNVSSVYLKLHPNQGKVDLPRDVPVLPDVPEFPHVAVVANSSVVIDLLHKGIPVFQNFDFDPVEDDYYGFVRNGIAGLAPTHLLREAFWSAFRFDEGWKDRFSDLYSGETAVSDNDRARLIQDIDSLLEQRTRPRITPLYSPPKAVAPARPASKLHSLTKNILNFVAQRAPSFAVEIVKHYAYSPLISHKKAIQELRKSVPESVVPTVPFEKKVTWAQRSIAASREPFDWLRHSTGLGILTEEEAIKSLSALYVERNPIVFDMFDTLENNEDLGRIFLWLSFKRTEISGVDHPYPLQGMVEATLSTPVDRWMRAELEGLVFGAVLRANRYDLLDLLFERGTKIKKDRLSTTRRIALLRYLWKSGRHDEYDTLRQEFWQAETPFHRLKIADVDGTLETGRGGQTHSEIEFAFRTSAPSVITREYDADVRPVYDRWRSKMRFMDVRSSAPERQAFDDLVLYALRTMQPFSMIRLSDGEGHAFAEREEFFSAADRKNRERHWWGVELDARTRAVIAERVKAASDSADVLGIPSIHRFVRDLNHKSVSMKSSIQGRGLLQVLHHFKNSAECPLLGDEKMNLPIFHRTDKVQEMIAAAKSCVIVSSTAPEALPGWLNEPRRIKHVQIPTHFRTSRNAKYHQAPQALPFIYEEIDDKVRELSRPGALVLVAGGIIGKIFIGTAKSHGAVALDLGSVMDEWAEARIHALH